jgi:hypothetical protein
MDLSSLLLSLTVSEFTELVQEQFKLFQIPNVKKDVVFETDDVDINWVSENLKMPKPTIYTKVSKSAMPCKKRGKPMVFSKKETIEWVEKGKPPINQEIDFAPIRKNKKLIN